VGRIGDDVGLIGDGVVGSSTTGDCVGLTGDFVGDGVGDVGEVADGRIIGDAVNLGANDLKSGIETGGVGGFFGSSNALKSKRPGEKAGDRVLEFA